MPARRATAQTIAAPITGAMMIIAMAVASLSGSGCAWFRSNGPNGPVTEQDLHDIREVVHPYELAGRTADGLSRLNEWIEAATEELSPQGHRLRADTLVDLWLYAQLARDVDPDGAARALNLVSQRGQESPPDPITPGDPSAGSTRQLLTQAVAQRVADDLSLADVSEAERELMAELVAFEVRAPGADRSFGRWRLATTNGPRLRLLLAWLFYHHGHRWLSSPAQPAADFYWDVSWLCTEEPLDDFEALAGACGFWCADLAEASDGDQAPSNAPIVQRAATEIAEDDTPVEVPLDSPVADQSPAPSDPATARWRPTPGDVGYELVQLCGGDYFGLPRGGGTVLLDPRGFVDMVYLTFVGELLSGIETDLLQGEPLTVLASPLIAVWVDGFLTRAVQQHLTPAAYGHDARLELPRRHGSAHQPGVGPDSNDMHPRLLVVLSTGVFLAVPPQIGLSRRDAGGYELVYRETADGYHFPGRSTVPFHRLNRIDPTAVSDGHIADLSQALGALDDYVGELCTTAVASNPEAPGCEGTAGISALVDGSTYFETLRPILRTALGPAGAPLRFHAVSDENDLVTVPLRVMEVFGEDTPSPHHRLVLRAGSMSLITHGDENGYEISRDEPNPLMTLHDYIRTATAAADLDPSLPVVVSVQDGRLDFGTLIHLVVSLDYPRDLDGLEGDADLLEAPPSPEALAEDTRSPLFDGGVWLELGPGS